MMPRFVGRLGVADAISAANAALGFVAVVVAPQAPRTAARLVLLAAVADGLDGVVARKFGGSKPGPYLDSLADVASFAVAPAAIVAAVASLRWPLASGTAMAYVAVLVPALYVAMAVVRLALYTAFDTRDAVTEGVPSTLAATILAAAVLAGVDQPTVVLGATGVFCYLMVSTVEYPDLLAVDALLMGVVNVLAVLVPEVHVWVFDGRIFPYAILFLALAYLLAGPWFYWRDVDASAPKDGAPQADDAGEEAGGAGDRSGEPGGDGRDGGPEGKRS
jgi:CDP-diacylglycerol--serine O-phosphatidyltransferase